MIELLITGGTGMVGQAILRQLSIDYDVSAVGSKAFDLRKASNARKMMRTLKPKKVIHLAGRVGGIKANSENLADFFNDNILINTHVLMAAHKYDVQNVVSLLSTCVYPAVGHVTYPLTESQLHKGPPHDSNFGYAYAKRMVEVQSRAYRIQHGRNYTTAIPNNIYGPCFSGDTEVLTPAGIKNIKNIKKGETIYTLNLKTFEVEVVNVIATTKSWSKEEYNFTGKAVDFCVTPEHKMFYKTSSNYVKKPASIFEDKCGKKYGQITFAHHKASKCENNKRIISLELYIDAHHLLSNSADGTLQVRDHKSSTSKYFSTMYCMDDFAELVGWYLSEGSMNTFLTKGGKQSTPGIETGQISISQDLGKNPANHLRIRNLLTKMSIPHGWDNRRIYFTSRLFRNFFKEETGCGSMFKRIPSLFFAADSGLQARSRLFESMMLGDGHSNGGRYTTKSKHLQEDFLHLCFLLAKKVSSVRYDGCYRINLRNTKTNVSVKYKNITNKKTNITQPYYCVTASKNNIIFAGRNSKFNWVGQCDNFDLLQGHVVPAVVRKIYEAKTQGAPLTFWGDGQALREFTYVDDIAVCLLQMAGILPCQNEDLKLCNIGLNDEVSIRTLVKLVAAALDYDGEIAWDTTKPNGQHRKPSLASQITHTYKPLEEGLRLTCKWFVANYPNVRGVTQSQS